MSSNKDLIDKTELLTVIEDAKNARDIDKALEGLCTLERKSRLLSDFSANTALVQSCLSTAQRSNSLDKVLTVSSELIKRRGFVKESIRSLLASLLEQAKASPNSNDKARTCQFIIDNSDGKIFCEVERSRAVSYLASLFELNGNLKGAADLLLSLQVETFGSMEKREKTNFLLEQIRIAIAIEDFSQAQIISRKISKNLLQEESFFDEYSKYFKMMLIIADQFADYLKAAEYNEALSDKSTSSVKLGYLTEAAINRILSPICGNRTLKLNELKAQFDRKTAIHAILSAFTAHEIINFDDFYGDLLQASPIFSKAGKNGSRNVDALKMRIVEHETEEAICRLISVGQIAAKIDRVDGIIEFSSGKNEQYYSQLAGWSDKIEGVLKSIVTTSYSISKEQKAFDHNSL